MQPSYDLRKFIDAQRADYALALSEIKRGKKESHWISSSAAKATTKQSGY